MVPEPSADKLQSQFRRSTREKKEPKYSVLLVRNDDYFMGRIEIEDMIGDGEYEVAYPSFSFFLFIDLLFLGRLLPEKKKEKLSFR